MPLPHNIEITNDDINYAKSLLIGEEDFNDERTDFIKRFTSVDLQACPGSGKTTCLLAKLLILDRYLPFENNSGILVLSHTNAAVDEIKRRIQKHSTHISQYPNFIGTIQGFINQFLAIPYYAQEYKQHPYRIDDEIFKERLWEPSQARAWLNRLHDKEEFLQSLRFDKDGNLIKWIDGTTANFPLNDQASPTYQALLEMRRKVLQSGYLCFDDAYYLAEQYMKKFPSIVNLIQARFGVVFIDEMQDTDTHQLKILETLFPNSKVMIQRIGDQNQAIYGRVKSTTVWQPGANFLSINGSKRLSNATVATIKNICINPQNLTGNAKRKNIKPKIILFDDHTVGNVIGKFGDLIIENKLYDSYPAVFKAIGWVKEGKSENGNNKLGITSYFPNYQVATHATKQDFEDLSGYLLAKDIEEANTNGLASLRKLILSALVKILRHGDVVRSDNGRPHSIQSLLVHMRENNEKDYEQLKLNLYKWTFAAYQGQEIQNQIKIYFNELLASCFKLTPEKVNSLQPFFSITQRQTEPTTSDSSNVIHHVYSGTDPNGTGQKIKIKVGTIHSIKGETHTATLYLETFYYNHESQKIAEQIKGNPAATSSVRILETLKMAYVGMSRPTDLLCIAIHISRLPSAERQAMEANWDIIELTTEN